MVGYSGRAKFPGVLQTHQIVQLMNGTSVVCLNICVVSACMLGLFIFSESRDMKMHFRYKFLVGQIFDNISKNETDRFSCLSIFRRRNKCNLNTNFHLSEKYTRIAVVSNES